MKERLEIYQKQQLTQRLSPRQIQYVRLLEMTAPEVEEEVRRQLDDNPALEIGESNESPSTAEEEAAVPASDYDDPDDDPADRMPYSSATGESIALQIASDDSDMMSNLSEQVREMELSDTVEKISLYIIGNLDDNGYITRPLIAMKNDFMIATGIDISDEEMRKAFDVVRSLDPAGIGAVDLRDCLILQLDRKPLNTPHLSIAKEIVKDYFDLLSKKHYDRLQMHLGLRRREELSDAIKLIQTLNPKPGLALHTGDMMRRTSHIVPDVAVEERDDGRFSVSLVSSIPQLQVERSFSVDTPPESVMNKREKEAQMFIKLKREDAEAFIAALRQRGNTLIRVTEAIVKRQADFFRTGDTSALRPMILKDISADTGFDLSAISRATAGKYVATQLGTFPLKMFFNEAPHEDSDMSSHQLMHVLQAVIDEEDKKHPLSDQAILEAMEAKGYKIARRTITKYREKLGIPVGRLRKKM